ncbi:GAF and ANTAR domain-containing protein [Arthrobacter sp. Br18]|uniref:GAF and ANTAR domain-containing protein n=1 Tax=Arthrobacter sp. Br18 TaxID=1312954 RepID=UPI00047A48EC|nr:GAF and ANTAR domain-containing protein [Arthrobacter sp. Br18]
MEDSLRRVELSERLQDLVLENLGITRFLEDLAVLSAGMIPGTADLQCGITVQRRNMPATVAGSTIQARILDEIQYRSEKGPGPHAIATGTPAVVGNVRTDRRWPECFSSVADRGYSSILAVPLVLEPGDSGALTLYASEPGVFTPELISGVEDHARQGAKALRITLRIASHVSMTSNLKAAMESCTAIDLAVGIIMAQNHCTQSEAVEILSCASSHRNIKLRDLAAKPIHSVSGATASTYFSA